ncbi:hypothetical protein [Xylanimonas ulmi]|uniref:hypothetical protein n=1 Tax=Xylanimonas ulmi TaxID=228973 RepID=UPI001F5EED4A|nr:hypothetical protein [Xylanibacterium ulmi]
MGLAARERRGRVEEAWLLGRVAHMADRAPDLFSDALDEVDDWDGSVSVLRERLLPALRSHARRMAGGCGGGR